MEIFQKEKWGFVSTIFRTVIVACFVIFPASIMVSVMYRYSSFDLTAVFEGNNQNSIALGVDPGNDSLHSTSSPEGEIHLNVTAESRIGKISGSGNVSSESTTNHDDEILNGTLYLGIGNVSDSINCSSQLTILPRGSDVKACISRYQSVLYRKTSSLKPSSYLLTKLRKYENLHKNCGPYTKSYNRTLKRLGARRSNSPSKCNYIVWLPANGLGNRMVSLASTFLYALLTNRVLLVDHGTDMADLFCEPFADASWLLPKHFPLKHLLHIRYDHSFGSLLRSGVLNMSMELPPSYLYLNLDHSNYDLDKKLFYCEKTEAFLRKVNWLFIVSDQYFAPSFFLNPSYKEEVGKLFPGKDTIFHHLGRYLFNPSNQAWGLITRFFDAYLAKADKMIGLQIRVFNPKTTPLQTVLDQILACTSNEKILPEVETQQSVAYSKSRNKTSKAILVTSLHSEFYGNLSRMYWINPTATGEVVGVYQPSHEEYQHFGDNKHNLKALAEIYLLSLSDVLVTSAWSTFGYVAQGLGGLKPWILFKTDDSTIPEPPCTRDLSMEPCYHFPPTYHCQEKEKVDVAARLPYLRHCQDLKGGVKLVSD